MLHVKRFTLVAAMLALLIGCMAGQQSIVVDTTGLPPEQVELIQWKVKYAVALDWYDWQLKSYKASLDALPLDQAKAIHAEVKPIKEGVDAAIVAFRAAAYSSSPNPDDQQAAYAAYLKAKSAMLAALTRLLQ